MCFTSVRLQILSMNISSSAGAVTAVCPHCACLHASRRRHKLSCSPKVQMSVHRAAHAVCRSWQTGTRWSAFSCIMHGSNAWERQHEREHATPTLPKAQQATLRTVCHLHAALETGMWCAGMHHEHTSAVRLVPHYLCILSVDWAIAVRGVCTQALDRTFKTLNYWMLDRRTRRSHVRRGNLVVCNDRNQ